MFFDLNIPMSPTLGASGIFRKDLWVKLGGLDKRFFGSFADIDLTLRFYNELGMYSFIPPDCSMFEVFRSLDNTALLQRSKPRQLLNSLWYKDGKLSKKRLSLVESF